MTTKAAKRLVIGDRVRWLEDRAEGTIIEANWCAIKIQWDDGSIANLWHDDHANLIERA